MDFNGNSFEAGRMWGLLQGHMVHHGKSLERQNEILLDIKDSLNDLPSRMAGMMTATPASASPIPKPRILPELSELIRALHPLLILMAAFVGKSALPETGFLRTVLDMVTRGGGL